MTRLLFKMLCPLTLLAQQSDNFSTDLGNWPGDRVFFNIDTTNKLQQTNLMDALWCYKEMHFNLLEIQIEFPLKRVNPELNYWQSWTESVGFCFQTLPNSQSQTLIENSNLISIEPTLFSTSNDGQDDLLQIKISLESGQYTVSLYIYGQNGLLIKLLQNNVLLLGENTFFCDGTNNQGRKVTIGCYILFLEAINNQGKIVKAKKTCVLGGRL